MNNVIVINNGIIDRDASVAAFVSELEKQIAEETKTQNIVGDIIIPFLQQATGYTSKPLIVNEVISKLNPSDDDNASIIRGINQFLISKSSKPNERGTAPIRVSKGRGCGYILWTTFDAINGAKAAQTASTADQNNTD